MNENVRFVVLIAIVVAAVGGAWYFLNRSKAGDGPDVPQTVATATAPEEPEAEPVPPEERAVVRPASPFQVSGDRAKTDSAERGPRRAGIGTIKGTVTLEDGDVPVPNATLRIVQTSKPARDGGGEVKDGPQWETETATDGTFRIDRLPYGYFAVLANTGDLFGAGSANLTDDEPSDLANVTLRPAGSIAGTVLNAAGEPVAGARVFPEKTRDERRRMGGGTGLAAQVKTNGDGTFFIPHLWEGDWQLIVTADAYAVLASDYIPVGTMDAELVLSPGGSAAGEVVAAETGEPIVGIKVTANGEIPRAENETETDEGGRFEIAHLADSKYTVNIDDDTRLLSGKAPEFTIAGGDNVDGLRLIVAVGGSVSGRAYDVDTKKPLQGVKLSARPDGGATPRREAESDANGVFTIEGLGEGPHTIHRHWKVGYLHGEDREDKKVNVQIGKTTPDIDFPMKYGLFVRGRVVDEDGNPIDHASVQSQPVNYNGEGENTTSREDGTFEHRGYSPNQQIRITASKAGYAVAPIGPLDLGDTDLNGIEIVMGSGGSIAGVAVDAMGNPMKEASVTAQPIPGQGEVQTQSASLDADGKFKIQGLMAATYRLQIRPYRSYRQTSADAGTEVTVGEGEDVTGVQVVYEEGGGLTISGRVTNNAGEPLRNASINAHMDRGGGYGYANTDENGNYTISSLQQGVYRVFAYHNDYTREEQSAVEAGTANVNFVLTGRGAIEGRVLSAKNGQPVTRFQVGAFPGQIDLTKPSMYGNMTAFVDPQGNFKLTNVEAGVVYVGVTAEGFAPSQQPVSGVREGATVSGVVFKLDPGATIDGIVTDNNGTPVSGARIFFGNAPTNQWQIDRETVGTSDANGKFTITSVGPETTAVSAVHGDYAPGSAQVSIKPGGTAQVTIRLGGGGTVEGRVTVAGQPAANQHVWIQRMAPSGQPLTGQTDGNGMYSIKGVPEGDAMVTANIQQDGSNRSAVQQAVIAEDRVTVVNFDFGGGNSSVEGYITMDGQPLAQGHVQASVTGATGTTENFGSQVDGNGYYRLDGLTAGAVALRISYQATENNWQMRTVQVSALDGRVARHDIEVTAGATIAGTVSGAIQQGQMFVGVIQGKMEITTLDPNFWMANQQLVVGNAMVQPDGTFRVSGIDPGDYTVLVVGFAGDPSPDMSNARFATEYISVSGDGEVTVNLTLP